MAFSGLHVSFHRAGKDKRPASTDDLPIYGELLASETMASAGTSSVVAPAGESAFARIIASADSYVTIGSSPADPADSATTTRVLLQAGEVFDIHVRPGDKVRWVAA